MNLEELFPLKAEITQEIIDKANTEDMYNCIGALTLQTAVEGKIENPLKRPHWGRWTGFVYDSENFFSISTQEELDLMEIRKPRTITFILK